MGIVLICDVGNIVCRKGDFCQHDKRGGNDERKSTEHLRYWVYIVHWFLSQPVVVRVVEMVSSRSSSARIKGVHDKGCDENIYNCH